MDAIILAAGYGMRLRPHTETVPKPMLPVQGRPILDWAIEALPPEVDRVLVVVNYLAEKIEKYLQTRPQTRELVAVRQEVPRGTGDALRSCQDKLRSDRFLVANGDDLYGAADLSALVACDAGVLVQEVKNPPDFGIAFLRDDGSLDRLVEKPDIPGPALANAGAYLFPRHVFETELTVSQRGELEITDYVSAVAQKQRVDVVRAQFWLPIGTIEVWNKAQTMDLGRWLSREDPA
jgi:bifunctional UDP-N-acetylglucosamine pyrophosphorylase/glucosamine-1-phosphate N-acetyltransferase